MANLKYKIGQFYRHKLHGFIVQITAREDFGQLEFRLIKGDMPKDKCFPGYDYENKYQALYYYSTETFRTRFELISGAGAEVLYGIKREEKPSTPKANG